MNNRWQVWSWGTWTLRGQSRSAKSFKSKKSAIKTASFTRSSTKIQVWPCSRSSSRGKRSKTEDYQVNWQKHLTRMKTSRFQRLWSMRTSRRRGTSAWKQRRPREVFRVPQLEIGWSTHPYTAVKQTKSSSRLLQCSTKSISKRSKLRKSVGI